MCEILSVSVPNGTKKWLEDKEMSASKLLQQRIDTIRGSIPGSLLNLEEENIKLKKKVINIYDYLKGKNLLDEVLNNVQL